ncbi:MAG: hypothetical protein J5828_05630 [Desulfovibrionaceae bacterium]|nr:hypothetical protein [Desulfovibrionaceae bacterium]
MKRILLAAAAISLLSSPVLAEPAVKATKSGVVFKELVNDAQIAEARNQMKAAGASDVSKLGFNLDKIDNVGLESFAKAFPDVVSLKVTAAKGGLTSLAPLAGLSKLKRLELSCPDVADMSPLAGLTGLSDLNVAYGGSEGSLEWMSKLTNLTKVAVSSQGVTSLVGLPALTALKTIRLNVNVKDLEPLAALTGLKEVNLTGSSIGDLSALAKLPNLEKVNLYGASVKDFSPLAGCPNLKELTYYATKGSDYSTLGKLTQLTKLDGGLTQLKDISWIAGLDKLKEFDVFAEYVTDYTPLAGAKSLEKFKIWSMRVSVGDLGFLSSVPSLKDLTIDTALDAKNFAAIGTLPNLEQLCLREINVKAGEPLDLAFLTNLKNLKKLTLAKETALNPDFTGLSALKNIQARELNAAENAPAFDLAKLKDLPELTTLELDKSKVANFEAMSGLPKLRSLSLKGVKGVSSLESLKNFPALKNLSLSKGAFTDEQLKAVPQNVKVTLN